MEMAMHGPISVCRRQASLVSPPRSAYVFALFVLISTHYVVASEAVDKNADSLLKFKSSLENSGGLGSWNDSSTPCSGNVTNWIGVTCVNDNVLGLKLVNMSLAGKIDVDSLVPLSSLKTLSFQINNFQGLMPNWSKLSTLRSLNVSRNHFSGDIPGDSFQGMSFLRNVDLGNNEFTGNIPSSLSSLSLLGLRLQNNTLSGRIPPLQKGIKSLNLSNNQLEGPIPQSLAHFDPRFFSGNKGLCGKPVGSDCYKAKPKLTTLSIVMIGISLLFVLTLLVIVMIKYFGTKDRTGVIMTR